VLDVPGCPAAPIICELPCSNIFTLWLDWSAPATNPVSKAAFDVLEEYTYTPGDMFTLTWNGLSNKLNPKFSISSLTLKFAVLDVMFRVTLFPFGEARSPLIDRWRKKFQHFFF